MVVALALLVGFVVYHLVSSSSKATPASSGVASQHLGRSPQHAARPRSGASPVVQAHANEVVIHLAATANCWVQLTTASGVQIYQGIVYAGSSMHWTEHQAVSLMLGNPGGVSLTVNGRDAVPAGQHNPVTLSLGPGQKTFG